MGRTNELKRGLSDWIREIFLSPRAIFTHCFINERIEFAAR